MEMLMAIGIIAVVSAIGLMTYGNAQKRARDSKRISDLNQYRAALENFANSTGNLYPYAQGNSRDGTGIFSPSGPLQSYMTGFPVDPRNSGRLYYRYYPWPTASPGADRWVLWACPEAGATQYGYEVCSTGQTGQTSLECGGSADLSALNNATCDL